MGIFRTIFSTRKKKKKNKTKKDNSINKNKWKIAFTNDEHLTGHKKSRPVVIVADNDRTVKVARITSLPGKEKKIEKGFIKPLKGKYKNLNEPSGVDNQRYNINKKTGKRLTLDDEKVFRRVTNEKLNKVDRKRVNEHLHKAKKK